MVVSVDRTGETSINSQGLTGVIVGESSLRTSGGGNVLHLFKVEETHEIQYATYQNFNAGKWKSYEIPTVHGVGYSYKGASKSEFYHLWKSILDRCYNKSSPNYINFCAKNIKMDNEWLYLDQFEKDVVELKNYKYKKHNKNGNKYYLFRKDLDYNFSKQNCLWEIPSYIGEVRSNTNTIKTK